MWMTLCSQEIIYRSSLLSKVFLTNNSRSRILAPSNFCLDLRLLGHLQVLSSHKENIPWNSSKILVYLPANLPPPLCYLIWNWVLLQGPHYLIPHHIEDSLSASFISQTQEPDICYAVHKLSQFLSTPIDTHLNVALHILKYIKDNPGRGLFYPSNSDGSLKAFSDADWAICLDSRRSITGFSIFYGSSLISWKSKKQSVVSRSSSEVDIELLP